MGQIYESPAPSGRDGYRAKQCVNDRPHQKSTYSIPGPELQHDVVFSKKHSCDDVGDFQQAGDVASVVLERLREDHRWFHGHTVACENIGRALRLGFISPAKADYLRQQLTGEQDGYSNMGAMYRARYRADAEWGWG